MVERITFERFTKRPFPGVCAVGNRAKDYMDVLAASPGKGLFVKRSKVIRAQHVAGIAHRAQQRALEIGIDFLP